jgi:hypothetical protein
MPGPNDSAKQLLETAIERLREFIEEISEARHESVVSRLKARSIHNYIMAVTVPSPVTPAPSGASQSFTCPHCSQPLTVTVGP